MANKKDLIILFFIFLLGVFWRFFLLGSNPPSLYWDEVAIGLDGYSLATTGKDINGFSPFQPIFLSYGDYKAPVYIWLAVLPIKLLGLTLLAVRLPAAILGSILPILVWLLGRQLLFFLDPEEQKRFSSWPAWAALVTALNPWTIEFSRIGFESGVSLVWLTLSLWLFLKAVKDKLWFLILSALAALVSVYTYFSVRIIWPFLLVGWGVIFAKKLWEEKLMVIVSLVLGAVLLIPLFTSPFYQLSQQYRLSTPNLSQPESEIKQSVSYLQKDQNFFISSSVHHRYWFIGRQFLENYFSHFSVPFLFLNGDSNLRQHSGWGGELLVISLPFFLIGVGLLLKYWPSKLSQFILLSLLVFPLAASIPQEIPHASRAIYLVLPMILITGWGLSWFTRLLVRQKLVKVLVILGFSLNLGLWTHDYIVHYPIRSSQAWIWPYWQMAELVKQNHLNWQIEAVSEKYWQPQLYLLWSMPELLAQLQPSTPGKADLSLNHILKLTNQQARQGSIKVKFLTKEEIKANDQILATLTFLDGQPTLFLTSEK
ncbi:hypothetical protein A2160_02915 [Candidatus Beckwithbacteria bacterium RBG_13_42_9]|uniref:Glycosyltransferase RgtA/B/C/D-like domain-containing protein n=1 Tax=Candidatus Beckwithbacteria bacterium RBG_13_42_9 TaxID=1797457 RepID=A0A1F5E7Q1_9BACT|nr:MAG: hypothetical protein A2160_02915 [Candidatus Beckwithbacteria bacterium RBG_13_42_9]